ARRVVARLVQVVLPEQSADLRQHARQQLRTRQRPRGEVQDRVGSAVVERGEPTLPLTGDLPWMAHHRARAVPGRQVPGLDQRRIGAGDSPPGDAERLGQVPLPRQLLPRRQVCPLDHLGQRQLQRPRRRTPAVLPVTEQPQQPLRRDPSHQHTFLWTTSAQVDHTRRRGGAQTENSTADLEEEKMATVALIGTLDTKGTEYAWLADQVRGHGAQVLLIDVGTSSAADADVTPAQVTDAAGHDLTRLRDAGDRSAAMD